MLVLKSTIGLNYQTSNLVYFQDALHKDFIYCCHQTF